MVRVHNTRSLQYAQTVTHPIMTEPLAPDATFERTTATAALGTSNYCRYDGHFLRRPLDMTPPSRSTIRVHDAFRTFVLDPQFPCIGAKVAARHNTYRFGLYGQLGSSDASVAVGRDLARFVCDPEASGPYSTFVASFNGPYAVEEQQFEKLLWMTLQRLNDLDQASWSAAVSADPSDPAFSFSFAGTAFFIVGLHARSSRFARRFSWPTVVFNPHEQFERLKREDKYQRFQQVIRRAELHLQGELNPMLADFGDTSAARQYSGRRVDHNWQCPFGAHQIRTNPTE
jgi:uncharacterized protein